MSKIKVFANSNTDKKNRLTVSAALKFALFTNICIQLSIQ